MKLKTVKSAKKRIKITGQGKWQRRRLSAQHLVSGKSKRALRKRGRFQVISPADLNKIKKLVPGVK